MRKETGRQNPRTEARRAAEARPLVRRQGYNADPSENAVRHAPLSRRAARRIERLRRKQEKHAAAAPTYRRSRRAEAARLAPVKPPTSEELALSLSQEAALKAGFELAPAEEPSRDSIHFRAPRRVHLGLMVTVLLLLCFGLIMLFSASMTNAFDMFSNSTYWIIKQVLFTALALVVMYLLTRINPKRWNHPLMALVVYLVTTFFLIIVLIPGIGQEVNGQRRWLPLFVLPDMTFQPSEIAKLATVYCGAVYYSYIRKKRARGGLVAKSRFRQVFKDLFYDFLIPGFAVALWCALISQQSHWSSIIIISLILLVVFLSAGIRPRSWLLIVGLLAGLAFMLGSLFMAFRPQVMNYIESNPGMKHILIRLNVFSGDESASQDESYQSRHALIGIGSGGLTGTGLALGRQKFNWLPEIHNDYVFSNIGEELGFLGASAVILLFLVFFILGISVTLKAQSIYMQILAAGFSSLIAIQALLSIAVNLMVIPPTGISLPLFSYGGTSNIFFLVGIGFLLAVSKFGPKEQGGILLSDGRRRR